MQVQQVPNDDFQERKVIFGPILHILCSVEAELTTPATIWIPLTLQEDQTELPDPSSSHVRTFYRRDSSQEWVEITEKLKPPAKMENGVVTFQVNHFSM